MNVKKININQTEQTYVIASDFESVFDADGNTLTTVINNEASTRRNADEQLNTAIEEEKSRAKAAEEANAQAITKLSDSTEKIKKESIDTEDDYISVETISGEEVFRLDENGLNAKNVTIDGKEVALKEEIADLEVLEYIENKHEDTYTGEELILKSNNEEETYVSIGDYGIKAKAYKLLDGSDVFDHMFLPYKSGTIILDVLVTIPFRNFGTDTSFEEKVSTVRGLLKLPTNYTQSGTPVPLVFFAHGSGVVGSNTSTVFGRPPLVDYLTKEGYAVFDCRAVPKYYNDYYPAFWDNFGSPSMISCIVAVYNYIIKNYNVDTNNVFGIAKSQGGIPLISLGFMRSIPFKAICPLSPAINNANLGYTVNQQKTALLDYGFSQDCIDKLTDTAWSSDFIEAYNNELYKTKGFNPLLQGTSINLPITSANKWSLESVVNGYENVLRYYPTPIMFL